MQFAPQRVAPGRSPLTDLRALGASALFHVSLLIAAALTAFGVTAPAAPKPPREMNAEVGPVDNRAPADSGGGSPGELGGVGRTETIRLSAEADTSRIATSREDTADRLLKDLLPPSDPQMSEKDPLGPATTGIGLVPGEAYGGGGGSGGGSGGGTGKGLGPGTEFFGAQEQASSFAYVIDCSGSMSNLGALRIAKAELVNSLDRLAPDAKFTVIFYSVEATVFPDANDRAALMPATIANKERLKARLATVRPYGGTDHARALRAALATKPEVIFFLTDAETMDNEVAEAICEEAGGKTRIQAIEFGDGPTTGATSPLRSLATRTGGTIRHVDLSRYISGQTAGARP